MRVVRRLLLAIVLLVALAIVVPVAVVLLSLQDAPIVSDPHVPDSKDASRAKNLGKRMIGAAFSTADQARLTASAQDLSAAVAFAARVLPGARSRVNLSEGGVIGAVSVPMPSNPFGRYLNIYTGIAPSQGELNVTEVGLGDFEFSGGFALWMAKLLGDLVIGDDVVSRMVEGVESVQFTEKKMQISFVPVKELRGNLKDIMARLRDVRDTASPLGDPDVIGIYYARAAELRQANGGKASLAAYLGPMFELARQRSQDGGDAAEENQAMILALTMYLGEYRYFERLIGKVRTGELANVSPATAEARLAGRKDLMQHFLVSAGLQILADNGISYTIGEFKELLDSDGGSGFSFDDLAADRAGVRFAQFATDPDTAELTQALLADGAEEDMVVPQLLDLPTQLSEARFVELYGSVEDDRYKAMVQEIDRRIDRVPLYNS